LDARDRDGLRLLLKRARPDAVVNADGMTSVDGCERDPKTAMEINGTAAGMAAEECARAGIPTSTSPPTTCSTGKGVGTPKPTPNPVNEYGRSKPARERSPYADPARARTVPGRSALRMPTPDPA